MYVVKHKKKKIDLALFKTKAEAKMALDLYLQHRKLIVDTEFDHYVIEEFTWQSQSYHFFSQQDSTF